MQQLTGDPMRTGADDVHVCCDACVRTLEYVHVVPCFIMGTAVERMGGVRLLFVRVRRARVYRYSSR